MEVVVLVAVVEVDVHVWRGTCRNQVLRGSSVVVLGEMHVDGSRSRQETVVVHGSSASRYLAFQNKATPKGLGSWRP